MENGHPHRSTVNAGERQRMMEPHHRVVGNGQSQKKKVTLENIASAYQGEKNLSRDLSLGSDIPTPGLISRESHHSKRHVTPPFTATPPSVPEPESQEHFN